MNVINPIKWDNSFSVNNPEIDHQHKELINVLNDKIRHCSENKEKEREYLLKIKNPTIVLIKKHFKTEEKLLQKNNYVNIEEHKMEHESFLNKLNIIMDKLENNLIEMDLSIIVEYMKDWLIYHIEMYDVTAKEYFKGND